VKADSFLQQLWYHRRARWLLIVLLPLSVLFWVAAAIRRAAFRLGILRKHRVSAPVIVVGNITVGGTGKTPFVIWLADLLHARNARVGIVLRGYGGASTHWPREVQSDTSVAEVGDEAVLHASRTGAIVVAGPDRVAAAARAIELGAEVIVCDDGLQHYRLGRDCEIAVIDGQRALGNRLMLPAGPLREPASRLNSVDLIVCTQRFASDSQSLVEAMSVPAVTATARVVDAVSLATGEKRPLTSFAGSPVHAVAAIGNPEAFFAGLRQVGLQVDARALPDHAALTQADIDFSDSAPVFMTEKDAVKCRGLNREHHWAVPLAVDLNAADMAQVQKLIDAVMRSHAVKR